MRINNIFFMGLATLLTIIFIRCNDDSNSFQTTSSIYKDEKVRWIFDADKSDDFETFDRDKWNTKFWFKTSGDFAFIDENVTVKNGNLVLTAKKEKYHEYDYTVGGVISNFEVGVNTCIEVRAKTIDYRANITTAFWVADTPAIATNPNVEIDIMEILAARNDPQRFKISLHYWTVPEDHKILLGQNIDMSFILSQDFHVYRLERLEKNLYMYVDGMLVWKFNTEEYPDISNQNRRIILSIHGHSGDPVDTYLPGEFLIDYVHVYKGEILN